MIQVWTPKKRKRSSLGVEKAVKHVCRAIPVVVDALGNSPKNLKNELRENWNCEQARRPPKRSHYLLCEKSC